MPPLLFAELVLTLLTGLCTAAAIFSTRRTAAVRDECVRIIESLRKKLIEVNQIDDELRALDARIRKLNGRITARRGAYQDDPDVREGEVVDGGRPSILGDDGWPVVANIDDIVNGRRPK